MQITERVRQLGAFGRLPYSAMWSELSAIRRERVLRIWPEIRRNLFSLHLVYIYRIGLQGGVGTLKLRLHLLPRHARLSIGSWLRNWSETHAAEREPDQPASYY